MRRTSLSEIRDTLASLDVPRDRVVIVHSALLKFGIIERGAAGVMEVLWDVLGSNATLVMPAFTLSFGGSRVWDHATSVSEMGALTEHFRKLPDARRSLHPFHSVSAIGPQAADIVDGFCLSSFGSDSAFDRLYDCDALNVFIGTEFVGGATYLHMGEERANVPYRFMKKFPGDVRGPDGSSVDETFTMFARSITDEYAYDTDWSKWWDELSAENCFAWTKLAGGMFCVSEIKRTLDIFAELIAADPFRHSRAVPHAT